MQRAKLVGLIEGLKIVCAFVFLRIGKAAIIGKKKELIHGHIAPPFVIRAGVRALCLASLMSLNRQRPRGHAGDGRS